MLALHYWSNLFWQWSKTHFWWFLFLQPAGVYFMTHLGTILVNVSFQVKHNVRSAVTGWSSLQYQLGLLIDYTVQANFIPFSSCSACQLLRVIEVHKCQWTYLFSLVLLIYSMHFQRLLLDESTSKVAVYWWRTEYSENVR